MASIAKKLYFKKASTTYPITLYNDTANVGSNYLTLRVDGVPAYAQLAAVGTPGNSLLRVRKAGNVYAVNSSAQDSTLITSGGSVVDNGSCFVPPSSLTAGTYWCTSSSRLSKAWTASVSWAAISSITCMFTVSYQAHISDVGVHHYRLRYGLTSACNTDGGVFSGSSRSTAALASGTYYFRVDAEDAANNVLYSSAVYGGLSNAYTLANSTGIIRNLYVAAGTTSYPVNRHVLITGSQSWTVPAGVTYISAFGIGGGGGGSGAALCYRRTSGGGGGSGYFSGGQIAGVTPGTSLTIGIGAGGGGGWNDWAGSQPDRTSGRGYDGGTTYIDLPGGRWCTWGGGYGANRITRTGGAYEGANSGQDHCAYGLGANGGVNGTDGQGDGDRYKRSLWQEVVGGSGGISPVAPYGNGGDGASGAAGMMDGVHSIGGITRNASSGSNGCVVISYYDPSYNTQAITGTSHSWGMLDGAVQRYFRVGTYANNGYGTKETMSSAFCADTCTCNCNYCTCNCNYCTCNCNYCTCNCNYSPCSCSSSP